MAGRYWCNTLTGMRIGLAVEPGAEAAAREALTRFLDSAGQFFRSLEDGVVGKHVIRLDVPGAYRWSIKVTSAPGTDRAIEDIRGMLSRARGWQMIDADPKYFFASIRRATYGLTIPQTVRRMQRLCRRRSGHVAAAK
jgi:hypothetical protein